MPSPVQARSAARPSSADASNRFAPRAHLAHRSPHAACGSVVAYDRQTRKAIADLGDAIDTDAATAVWDAALGTPYTKEAVGVHGDVAQNNLLVRDGCLRAVIDFGTSAVGDPACDTVLAWTFLDGESREAFRERLPVDHDTWVRGRGWAIWKALITLAWNSQASPAFTHECQRVVVDVFAEHHAEAKSTRN